MADSSETVIWMSGYQPQELNFATEKVTHKYGIAIRSFGCCGTRELKEQIEKHNQSLDSVLTNKIGKDWKNKVFDEIYSVYRVDTALLNAFQRKYVRQLNQMNAQVNESYEFRVTSTQNPHLYQINAFLIDKEGKVTNQSVMTVEATYPDLNFKFIRTLTK